MLTGDAAQVAEGVAGALGITEWRARLLPEEKFDAVKKLRAEGRKVAMVGDGINDAPALAAANVGIAMGASGSDVAIETADIALAADDLNRIDDVLRISRETMKVVRQNYGLSLGINSLGLALAALGRLNPILAAVFHNLSTILVVGNSSRLIHFAPDGAPPPGSPRGGGRDLFVPANREVHSCCGDCTSVGASAGKKKRLEQQAADFS